MAYHELQGFLSYFHPNIPLATTTAGVMKEIDIGAASGDHGEYVCIKPCVVKNLLFAVTGEAVSGTTTAPTVIFTKRPTPLSSTSESVVGTLTIPSGTAVGKVVHKAVDTAFSVGDSMEISWTVGVGTPTGMGHAYMECSSDPEVAGNNSDMIASA